MGTTSIAASLRHALDPAAFARERLGFHPDEWQEGVLRSSAPRLILCCSRQSGKSTTTAVLALHRAMHYRDSLVLLVSPSLRQSSELFRKITDMLARLDERPKLTEDNKLSLRLENSSRICSLPSSESTIRGFSAVDLLIEDEAARVGDALYYACHPMLAVSGGRLVLMSTPWGTRGHFHQEWTNGGPTWQRVLIPATDCPRISQEFLEEEARTLGSFWYDQEYLCVFADSQSSAFRSADIEGAFSQEVEQWNL